MAGSRKLLILAVLVGFLFTFLAGPLSVYGESHSAQDESANVAEAVNPLDFKADLALWTAVVFVGVLLVLRAFAWKPLCQALDQRERHIRENIEEAEKANAEAKRLLTEYQEKLAAVENEVRAMIERARKDAQQAGEELVAKAKQQAEEEYQRRIAEIQEATDRALQELAQRGATLAVELAAKLIPKRLDPTTHQQMIAQALETISQKKPLGLN